MGDQARLGGIQDSQLGCPCICVDGGEGHGKSDPGESRFGIERMQRSEEGCQPTIAEDLARVSLVSL